MTEASISLVGICYHAFNVRYPFEWTLVNEPTNDFDPNACFVALNGSRIGFIPRTMNRTYNASTHAIKDARITYEYGRLFICVDLVKYENRDEEKKEMDTQKTTQENKQEDEKARTQEDEKQEDEKARTQQDEKARTQQDEKARTQQDEKARTQEVALKRTFDDALDDAVEGTVKCAQAKIG